MVTSANNLGNLGNIKSPNQPTKITQLPKKFPNNNVNFGNDDDISQDEEEVRKKASKRRVTSIAPGKHSWNSMKILLKMPRKFTFRQTDNSWGIPLEASCRKKGKCWVDRRKEWQTACKITLN